MMRCGTSTNASGSWTTNNKYTGNYGDPLWVYYQYRLAKGDNRPKEAIYAEGRQKMKQVEERGVDLATRSRREDLGSQPRSCDQGQRVCTMTPRNPSGPSSRPRFITAVPNVLPVRTLSKDSDDYIAHPTTGEALGRESVAAL